MYARDSYEQKKKGDRDNNEDLRDRFGTRMKEEEREEAKEAKEVPRPRTSVSHYF